MFLHNIVWVTKIAKYLNYCSIMDQENDNEKSEDLIVTSWHEKGCSRKSSLHYVQIS